MKRVASGSRSLVSSELTFSSPLDAKRVIADYLGLPLGKLPSEQLDALNVLLATTLSKHVVFEHVRRHNGRS
jgi:hypothetical protein